MSSKSADHVPTKMPENASGEWGLVAVKAVASLLPFAGGPAAEVLGALIQPQIERRKTEWLEEIARGLDDLSMRVTDLTPERLSQSAEFATAFLHVSQNVMRTHQREKLEALRNAVLNVAAGNAPDPDIQIVLLSLVDALTPSHVRVLHLFVDPGTFGIQGGVSQLFYPMGPAWDAVQQHVPVLAGNREYYHFFVNDLINHGLITAPQTGEVPPAIGSPLDQHPTRLAYLFLAFITSPLSDETNAPNADAVRASETEHPA